jgi:hypothetical protein
MGIWNRGRNFVEVRLFGERRRSRTTEKSKGRCWVGMLV